MSKIADRGKRFEEFVLRGGVSLRDEVLLIEGPANDHQGAYLLGVFSALTERPKRHLFLLIRSLKGWTERSKGQRKPHNRENRAGFGSIPRKPFGMGASPHYLWQPCQYCRIDSDIHGVCLYGVEDYTNAQIGRRGNSKRTKIERGSFCTG